MFKSISKIFRAKIFTGTLSSTMNLKLNFNSVLAYAALSAKVFRNLNPALIDVNALTSVWLRLRKNHVVDFRTPLSYELKWLGHDFLSSIAHITEKVIGNIELVIAVNSLMARYCKSLGAKNVIVIPNYPTKDFKSSIGAEKWKTMHGLSISDDVVLFSGGARVREIYGLDMLLESWKYVESSQKSGILVILGNDAIDYNKSLLRSLGLKRVLLPGRVGMCDVANWINCAKVCVAPRTPGFSEAFYNDQDSNKISEYAAFKKSIVATSYAPSDQYLSVSSNSEGFAEGILKGLEGNIHPSKSHYWEDNEYRLLESLEDFWFG